MTRALRLARVAHREHIARVVRGGNRILDPTDVAHDEVSERNLRHRLRGHQIAAQQAGDGLSVFFRDRGAKNRRASGACASHCHPRLTIVKPLRSSHASPASCGEIPVAAIDEGENAAASAVGNFQQHRAVALVRVLRADGNEVGGKFDLAVLQVHGVAQIDDALVVRIGHGEREVDASGDALVGARIAERLAVEDIGAGSDLDANDTRVQRQNDQSQNQEERR